MIFQTLRNLSRLCVVVGLIAVLTGGQEKQAQRVPDALPSSLPRGTRFDNAITTAWLKIFRSPCVKRAAQWRPRKLSSDGQYLLQVNVSSVQLLTVNKLADNARS